MVQRFSDVLLREPLRGRFPFQRLSVLLPPFVLPLENLSNLWLTNTLFLQKSGFYEFTVLRDGPYSLRSMPFKPHEWLFKLQKSSFRPFKARSLRGWEDLQGWKLKGNLPSENQGNALRQVFPISIQCKNRVLIIYGCFKTGFYHGIWKNPVEVWFDSRLHPVHIP